ncbi:MAG: hypothetical protein M0Q91_17135, partial [Methanoregula sp.]|nr:hypothetical protein [Methanoregula sp.]
AEPEKTLSRNSLLEIASDVIRDLQKKGLSGRFRDPDTERLRDAKTRLLIQSLQTYTLILRDHEITELEKRITELERQKECESKS